MRKLTLADVTIEMEVEPEDSKPEQHFSDPRDVAYAKDQRSIWRWCRVTVVGKFNGLTARDSLGGCSYPNEEAFKSPDSYYLQMCDVVLEDLQSQVDKIVTALQ